MCDVLAISIQAMNEMSENHPERKNIGTEILTDLTRILVEAIAEKANSEKKHKHLSFISHRNKELDTTTFMLVYTPRSVASNVEVGDLFYAFAKNREIHENRTRSN
jgi:hypothetical protein